jgi:hypothetical protein
MTCKGKIARGTVYAYENGGAGTKVIGYIRRDDEMPVVWLCDEIVSSSDGKLSLYRTTYDEVTGKTDRYLVAAYSDECAVASFEQLFKDLRYDDFKALWAYIIAKAKTQN